MRRLPDHTAWSASFGARTPVELIAAVTDALIDPAPTANAPSDPYEPLHQRGWLPAPGANALVSPDVTADVQHSGTAQDPGAWFITATHGPNQPIWQARFGVRPPPHLIAAFTAAPTDPKPAPRTNRWSSLPTHDPDVSTCRPAHGHPRRARRRGAGEPRPLPRFPLCHPVAEPDPLSAAADQEQPPPLIPSSPPGST
ncbi:DUF317 domain-containing protein [Streptomyces canus]|uniref:DUF317 domain-containing protein n=1 Tax=Streptomyces canus TaxID=58343 RepID=UPI0036EFF50F